MRQPVPFGKYLLLDRISVGGMAEVFKAKSYGVEGFEKIIAIKRILPTMGEDRDFIKMFIDEAKIAGQLAHANICQIFELGRIDGSHFIAMEYIWGKDLLQIQNRLRKIKQPMPIPMACFSIAKVLEGLDYAHRKRDPLGRPLEIVHRDCSPQNVLVSYEGEVKIIDFGIAKATSRNSRTMAGVLKGKFGYMSPEQVRGLPLDRRSDIFALGTMLYECLTGDRLFQGETDFSTLEKVRNVDIQNPRAINPAIPEEVEKVILKALAKDVEDRYQWCSEMLADLQQFLMSQDVVFTAKSLSSWLKDVFAAEIERERQQLEQYKRVGRDGLIAGVPAAQANLDIVETLGEASPVEGDPTVLGGPSFDDVEQAVGASAQPEAGPASGSPASRGGPLDEENDGDFGEEAPTEIFGEIDQKPQVPAAAAPVRPSGSTPPPVGSQSRPPRPPPTRPPTQQPLAAANGAVMTPRDVAVPAPNQPSPEMGGFVPAAASPAVGYPMQPVQGYGQQMPYPGYPPAGTPNAVPVAQMNALAPPNSAPGRTLLGAAAPPGLPNYSQGYPPQGMPPGSQPPMGARPTQPPPYGYPPQQPGMPMQQQPMYPSPYGTQNPYGNSGQYISQPMPGMGQAPVEQVPPEGRKKSSIARDVAIGVAIAALVLGGFLIVKFFVLDSGTSGTGSGSDTASSSSSIATIRLSMPAGISADLFVDEKKVATVSDKQEIPVTAGQRKVRLVGPNGSKCEQEMKLPAGKTTTLECTMYVPTAGSGSASVAAGSGANAGSGSAAIAAGSGSAAGSNAGSGSATVQPPTIPPIDKTDKMPAEDKKTDKTVKTTDKTPDKTTDKHIEKKQPTPPADDDLGTLQGGTRPGDKKKIDDKKDEKASPAADAKGYLSLSSKPSAKILIDGADSGITATGSAHTVSLPPGKHKVTFVIGTDTKTTYQVTIKAGETTPLEKNFAQ